MERASLRCRAADGSADEAGPQRKQYAQSFVRSCFPDSKFCHESVVGCDQKWRSEGRALSQAAPLQNWPDGNRSPHDIRRLSPLPAGEGRVRGKAAHGTRATGLHAPSTLTPALSLRERENRRAGLELPWPARRMEPYRCKPTDTASGRPGCFVPSPDAADRHFSSHPRPSAVLTPLRFRPRVGP